MKKIILLFLLMFLVKHSYADEVLSSFNENSVPVLNEELRQINQDIRNQRNKVVTLSKGGTGQALVDPGQDALFFWDDTTGYSRFIGLGTGVGTHDQLLVSQSGFRGMQVFSASGVWTKPAIVTQVYVKLWGGGGGGGGATTNSYGGGGGGGGYAEGIMTVSGNVYVTIGTGGLAGSNLGGTGGTSTFSTMSCGGGGGGNSSGGIGTGGSCSGGSFSITGSSGNKGSYLNFGGEGGSSFGYSGAGISSCNSGSSAGVNGLTCTMKSCGGGGAIGCGSTGASGGAGGDGYAIIYW